MRVAARRRQLAIAARRQAEQSDEGPPHHVDAAETGRGGQQPRLTGETLWYRMVAGGPAPRYVRFRPRPNLATLLDGSDERALPETTTQLLATMTIEILNLRPTMSYGLPPSGR